MADISTEFIIIALLLVANGVFAMAELAVVSARKTRLRQLADEGDARAANALKLAENPTRFLSSVQVGITLIGVFASAFGGARIAEAIEPSLAAIAWLAPHAEQASLVLVVVVLTVISVVVGELVPKSLALSNPEGAARLLAGPVQKVTWIFTPIVHLLTVFTEGVMRVFGVKPPAADQPVTDEELTMLAQQGVRAGTLHQSEQEMLEGVLALDQLPITALMTPRPKIVFLNLDDPEETNWRKIVTSGHSHFPVYQSQRDQVVGMISVKTLWAQSALGVQTSLRNLLVPPIIVPETMHAIQLLESFKKSGRHIALVADEFGSIQGLVSLIDVLEAIFGDLPQQGQRAAPETRQREDGSWLVDATLTVADLKSMLAVDTLPHEDEAGFQTLGGLVMTHFGRVPRAGDAFEWEGWRFEVMDMDRHRVDKVLVGRVPAATSTKSAA